MTNEFIIDNIALVDGAGAPARRASVYVKDGVIAAVDAEPPTGTGAPVRDGGGRTLTPGFIDPHTHSDVTILAAPESVSRINQGITTDLAGNCGISPFPVSDRNRSQIQRRLASHGLELTWNDFSGYAAAVTRRRPATNIGVFCGHNAIRSAAVGVEKRKLDDSDLDAARDLLRSELKAGAFGMSSGLIYVPGKFCDHAEMTALLTVLAEFPGKRHVTHMRDEGDRLIEALTETLETAAVAGLDGVHVSHLKTQGKDNWGKLDAAIRLVEDHRRRGLSVTADRYPYVESETSLAIILPPPCDAMTNVDIQDYLRDETRFQDTRKQLREFPSERWKTIRLACADLDEFKHLQGETFDVIGERLRQHPADVCADILRGDAAGANATFKGMSPDNMKRILQLPWVCCGSDESAKPLDDSLGRGHPRGFGSFPRFINALRNDIGLEKAIAKVTSLPADIFGLKNRGRIVPGAAADLVLLNPDTLRDTATYAEPHGLCAGIDAVWVNGALTYDQGEFRESRAGAVLR